MQLLWIRYVTLRDFSRMSWRPACRPRAKASSPYGFNWALIHAGSGSGFTNHRMYLGQDVIAKP